MNDHAARPQLRLRPFGEADEVALMSWFATRDELRLFAGDSLRWPLDRRQLALIRTDPGVTPFTAIAAADGAARLGDAAADGAAPQDGAARLGGDAGAAALKRDVIVGHIELTRLPERGWCRLARVAIAPEHRGRGFGSGLVNAALDQARSLGAVGVDLRVYESNSTARATYRGAGFTDIGRDRSQPELRWMIKEFARS
jgi:ribosomal protein S18 acetylase RimI-like enzyme